MARVLRALGQPRVRLMLMLGFASGLPFMLTANTLGFWLRENGLSLSTISMLSWVGLAYTFRFLWAPVVDRQDLPLIGGLGRRRSWMLLAQVGVAAALAGMAVVKPSGNLVVFGLLTVAVAFSSSTQDMVMDAWRIESAENAEDLGLMTSSYQLGYRGALWCTQALILILAQWVGWAVCYLAFGAAMLVGIAATLMAREPARADAAMQVNEDEAPLWTPRGFFDAVIGPFVAFFRAHKTFGLVMLATITLYHLSDYLRGPIVNPFYLDAGYTKVQVGLVRTTFGLWASLMGVALGGLSSLRLGFFRTLIAGAVLQPLGIAAFALVALHGAPDFGLFAGVNVLDDFAIGFSGVALVAYMSSLTSLGYTASQYAVMTSALAFAGKTLKGFSGGAVEALQHGGDKMHGYALFYLGDGAVGLLAIALCFVLAARGSPPLIPANAGTQIIKH